MTADVVVRATEAWAATLPGERRTLLPVYSLMIATEPLPATFWAETGLAQRESFSDHRRLIIYGQRTADDRLAFGGRGAPYHFGSSVRPSYDRAPQIHESLRHAMVELFPGARDAPGHPFLGRADRGAAGLVLVGRARPHLGAGLGGWLRGRRRLNEQPRWADTCRPGPREGQRARRAPLGRPPFAQVGARTVAVDRSERGAVGDQVR